MLDAKEIRWIVENLFVGNKLAAGEAEWSDGRAFDLRAIKSPIIIFASLGDNITPPQQAFNWVLDLYPTTEALKANGQVIVGLTHKSVGHLGIFVSGQVAKREHSQIVDLIEYIEHLAPGVYAMNIDERDADGQTSFDVVLHEVRLEDLASLQRYGRRDEAPFEIVADVSGKLAKGYEKFVHPTMAAMINPAAAKAMRSLHPQRLQRWAISELNPCCKGLKEIAGMTKANRAPRNDDGPTVAAERLGAALLSSSLDLYRDLRDATVENMFYRVYSTPSFVRDRREEAMREPEEAIDVRASGMVADALSHMGEGGRTSAAVRVGLLLIKAGTGRRRLSAMKRTRELVGDSVGLLALPTDEAQRIIRQQSYIVDFEPEKALATLPALLASVEDRQFMLGIIDQLEQKFDANPAQTKLVERIRILLSTGRLSGPQPLVEASPVHAAGRRARDTKQEKGAAYERDRRSSHH
jgi:hypothetical protein